MLAEIRMSADYDSDFCVDNDCFEEQVDATMPQAQETKIEQWKRVCQLESERIYDADATS